MKQLIKPILMLNLFFIGYSYAACTRTDAPATVIYVDMGAVVVNPNLNVGDVIKTQSWPITATPNLFYCRKGEILDAAVNTSMFTGQNNTLFQTNVPGVGMIINRGERYYPYSFVAPEDNNLSLAEGTFTVTLYKTDEYVGSGALNSGLYTWYGPKDGGAALSGLTSYMSEKGTTIISPSCTVTSGAQQNVYLETINYTELKTVGATAGETNFSIQLKCNGGASTNIGYDNVSLTFSGTIPANMSNADGVLSNDISSSGAKGIGVQVLDSKKVAIQFDKKYTVGSLATSQNGYFLTTNYIARYYRYGSTITPGDVEAKMIFNINYD